jgi:hypothetical protein
MATVGAPKNRTIGFQLWRLRRLLTLTPDRPRLREDVAQGWRSYLDPSSPESG